MWDISPRRPRSKKGLQNLFPSIAKNEAWVYNRGVLVVIEDSTGVLVSAAKADSLVHLLPYPSLLRTPTNLCILQCIHGHFYLHSIWLRKSGTAQFQHCRTSNKGNKSCISNITKMPSDLSLLEMSLMGKKKTTKFFFRFTDIHGQNQLLSTKAQKLCHVLFTPFIGRSASRLFWLSWELIAHKRRAETIHSWKQGTTEVWPWEGSNSLDSLLR